MEFRLVMLSLAQHPAKTAGKKVVMLPEEGHRGIKCRHLIPAKRENACFVNHLDFGCWDFGGRL